MKNLMKTAPRISLFVLGTLIAMEVVTLAIMKEQHLGGQGTTATLLWHTSMLFLPLLGYYLYKKTITPVEVQKIYVKDLNTPNYEE